jgi:GT2 family glycosyltransferase
MKENSLPKVSIILLNYNGFEDTIECFNSLKNITYSNYNIVIVDNNSPDDSMSKLNNYMIENKIDSVCAELNEIEKLKENKYVTLIQSGFNGGYGHGNNIGIKYALNNGSDYILVLNNDTIVENDFLEPLVQELKDDSNIGIISSQIFYEDRRNIFWENGGEFNPKNGKVKHTSFNEVNIGQLNNNCTFLSGCCWLIPRKIFLELGLINENYFMYVEDLEFCQRVLYSKYILKVSHYSKIYHKVGSSSGGGDFTKLSAYYIARNKLIFISSKYFFGNKLIAILYILIEPLRLIKNKQKINIVLSYIKGILSFIFRKDKNNGN